MPLPLDFRLPDILDILIIAVVVYQTYKLLIGSRAWNVLRGFIALAGLWVVATQFSLLTTRWLFDRAAPVAFFAVIVVFQPEVRAVLEQMGRGRGQRSSSKDPTKEIMQAVRDMAGQRIGALIAVERQTPLAEYGKTGSPLKSPVSAALLHTIFDSKGPLHDGGVIVSGDQVSYAGAIFPLSDRHEGWVAKHGTRHRAALGLSEASDALVIVVSEERGTVSLAQHGVLRSDIPPSDVQKALRDAYATT